MAAEKVTKVDGRSLGCTEIRQKLTVGLTAAWKIEGRSPIGTKHLLKYTEGIPAARKVNGS